MDHASIIKDSVIAILENIEELKTKNDDLETGLYIISTAIARGFGADFMKCVADSLINKYNIRITYVIQQ